VCVKKRSFIYTTFWERRYSLTTKERIVEPVPKTEVLEQPQIINDLVREKLAVSV
jgi:hypothetical protein